MTRIALMFPGQGAQTVGMGKDLVERYPHLEEQYFHAADEVLGFDLTRLCMEGPAEELRATENTQPAILTVSLAVWDVLRRQEPDVGAVAGHSLGEYAALVCAGVLDFPDALRLVRRRGELMASVNRATPGTMAAVIGLDAGEVDRLCAEGRDERGLVVEPANYNEPRQTVVSGEETGVRFVTDAAQDAGARVVPLEVGAPFHSSLMEDMAAEFAETLQAQRFAEPRIPIVANVTGDYVRTADAVRAALARQVSESVRWTDTVRRLDGDGYRTFVECGPGRVLSGFARRILPDADVHSTGKARHLDQTLAAMDVAAG